MESIRKRPIYLNLFKIRLPVSGVVSIVHRITGVILVLLLPVALYLLQLSLHSPTAFEKTVKILSTVPGRIAVLLVVWLFAQHFFSGVRHLLLDIHIGVEKEAARRSAWLTWVASVVTLLLLSVWIV